MDGFGECWLEFWELFGFDEDAMEFRLDKE